MAALVPAALCAQQESKPEPYRVQKDLPDWLTIYGHQRTRYESLDENFRAGRSGSNQGFFLRTALFASVERDWLEVAAEFLDSRAADFPVDAPLNTTLVNSAELLQGYVGANLDDVIEKGDELRLQLGRHTMNVGSRRLVARNRFRNTINAFGGFNAQYKTGDFNARAFYVIPTQRLVNDSPSLRDNEVRFDEERTQVRFFGLHVEQKNLFGSTSGEAYFLGINEEDGQSLRTRDRELYTVGTRLLKKKKKAETDYEVEAIYQFGNSRASGSSTTNLDHEAFFIHGKVGHTIDTTWTPRLIAQFDWASGDNDPNDGDNQRFDTLFGARRWEYGPTGILGLFARSNIISPGYRVEFKPADEVVVMAAHRYWYLASNQDAWTASGLRDATGAAGDYIGNMAEVRVRWEAVPGNVRIETGYAHLFAGSFVSDAPNRTTQGDVSYGYVHYVLTF